jgi:molybdopterin-guanine dinucleotide biosynthesis protein A
MNALGAIIAGGASVRFGSPKALAEVGAVRVIDRVARALVAAHIANEDIIAIVNDPVIAASIVLPHRPDVITGAGALGGVHAALLWARERDMPGILAVGCDMPFLSAALLSHLLTSGSGNDDIVIPESEGRRGIEPLCAVYRTTCLEPIERALARGDARMIAFHVDVSIRRIPLATVRTFGEPARMFMNLNTEADRSAAELHARETL